MNGMSVGNNEASASRSIPHSNSRASNSNPSALGVGSNSSSPSKSPSQSLKSKLFGSSHSNPPTNSESLEESKDKDEHHRSSFGSLFKSGNSNDDSESGGNGKKKMGRQALRKQRKQAETDEIRRQAEEELKANGGQPDLAEIERKGIAEMCKALNVEMKEVSSQSIEVGETESLSFQASWLYLSQASLSDTDHSLPLYSNWSPFYH